LDFTQSFAASVAGMRGKVKRWAGCGALARQA